MHIKWITGTTNQIHLAIKTANEFGITPGPMTFQFGSWEQQVQVQINTDIPEDVIGLPEQWKNIFTIPETLPYELNRTDTTLRLGPVIALIVFSQLDEMTLSNLNHYREYFSDYASIQGLVYICAWNTIDIEKKQIQGYYFDPKASNASNRWKFGTFPYPGSAYNRTAMPETVFNALLTVMGDRVFNSFSNGSFNKWELWKRLSPDLRLRSHLPATEPLTDITVLNNMLDRYGSIYLKPAGGTLSQGILKVDKRDNGYLVTYPKQRDEGKNYQNIIENSKSIEQWLFKLKSKEYLVQQAIITKRYETQPIDFRVIMQKDEKNQWNCTGIFGKFGQKGNIITNFSQNGFIRSGMDTFRLAFQMNDKKAQKKIEELKKISSRICYVFDQYGNYGDLGIDLMVDHKGKVWILEANSLDTYHRFPLRIDDRALYKKVVTSPFRYAKYLAGFQ
ncbi:YheC/YheD family protein [Sporosarcina sp. FA9]|uniref:YheC/YheD family endospore coat-associated protein n=1 Tax=Sporosarcina sp. FA9 TaxID=3413030 RepID=UPI003F6603ED